MSANLESWILRTTVGDPPRLQLQGPVILGLMIGEMNRSRSKSGPTTESRWVVGTQSTQVQSLRTAVRIAPLDSLLTGTLKPHSVQNADTGTFDFVAVITVPQGY